MSDSDTAALQRAATADSIDLEPRDARALTECMTVLSDMERASGADDLFLVVSASGSEYLVDARDERCECPDARHRDVRCKHQRRVAYVTGECPIPAWVDPTAIDELLGAHVNATPVVAATDGGARADATAVDESPAQGDAEAGDRPDDCDCGSWNDGDRIDLPCWPCYRDGFETPADVEETEN